MLRYSLIICHSIEICRLKLLGRHLGTFLQYILLQHRIKYGLQELYTATSDSLHSTILHFGCFWLEDVFLHKYRQNSLEVLLFNFVNGSSFLPCVLLLRQESLKMTLFSTRGLLPTKLSTRVLRLHRPTCLSQYFYR